jgi:hypothetical protein
LRKTRVSSIPHTFANLIGPRVVHPKVLEAAKRFNPDAIFCVAGSWSWMTILAGRIAKRIKTPLIGSFNDWWDYNIRFHRLFRKSIEAGFFKFYRRCELAICTSEGMYEALGNHINALVSYPTGAIMDDAFVEPVAGTSGRKVLAFAGNLGDWYGEMLEKVVSSTNLNHYEFKIFGSNPSWSDEFDLSVKERGFYKGQITFEQLKIEMKQVDGLLLFMGFDEKSAQVERTSFKTKFLDYLTFQRPIFLWGPTYCSAYRVAEEFDSAARCGVDDEKIFVELFDKVLTNISEIEKFQANSLKMYNSRFHPDLIHQKLVEKIYALKAN